MGEKAFRVSEGDMSRIQQILKRVKDGYGSPAPRKEKIDTAYALNVLEQAKGISNRSGKEVNVVVEAIVKQGKLSQSVLEWIHAIQKNTGIAHPRVRARKYVIPERRPGRR